MYININKYNSATLSLTFCVSYMASVRTVKCAFNDPYRKVGLNPCLYGVTDAIC
jgi:hypothetical protein